MTQTHCRLALSALLLATSATAAWAQQPRQDPAELVPAPLPGSDKQEGPAAPCCADKLGCPAAPDCDQPAGCPACAKSCHAARKMKTREIERRLHTVCPRFDFEEVPLRHVLENLHDRTGINFVLDQPALSEAGICPEKPLTLKVDGVALKSALNLLLHQAHLTYVVKDGVVNITTPKHAAAELVTRVLTVDDLVAPGACKACAKQDSGAPCCAQAPCCPAAACPANQPGTCPVDRLIQLITVTTDPMSWTSNGGRGTIDYYPLGRSLVVNQTAKVHKQIEGLLAALRQCGGPKGNMSGPVADSKPFVPPRGTSYPTPFADPGMPAVYPVPMMVEAVPAPAGAVGALPPVKMSVPFAPPPAPYPLPPEPCPPPASPYAPAFVGPPVVPLMAPEAARAGSHAYTMRVVAEGGKEKLEIHSDGGVMTCEGLEMKAPSCCRVQLKAAGKQIHLSGPSLTATADSVARTGKPSCLVLAGHVQLKYEKAGERAEVTAEHVMVDLADGHLEIKSRAGGKKGPAHEPESLSLTNFSFWSGFFH